MFSDTLLRQGLREADSKDRILALLQGWESGPTTL
jgi:hypothetical protein